MKLFFCDVETTGTKYWKNGIHQISGCIEIDGDVKEYFDFKVKPYKDALIEDEALLCSNTTREQIAGYADMIDVHKALTEMLKKYVNKFDKKDKFFFLGFNSSFDNQFLRAFFVQCKDDYFGSWFWAGTIDVMVLALEFLIEERPKMENFQLKTVAKFLEIPVDENKLHDAIYDIDLTRQIYQKL